MFDLIFRVITSWQVLLISAIFIIMALLFLIPGLKAKSKKKFSKRKSLSESKDIIFEYRELEDPHEKNPGKLYVPDSNYEILKKEGLIHPPNEK